MPTRPIIYRPKGRALEYAPLAANLYDGCGHRCAYPCYAPGAMHKRAEAFFGDPRPRANVISDLARQAAQWPADKERVLLCFSCDPYQPIDDEHQLTRQALEILHRHGFPTSICTKGGTRAMRDFDVMRSGGTQFGQTICFYDEDLRRKWEPGASSIAHRFDALRAAHDRGIYTWLSLEPVIDLGEALLVIERATPYCDEFRVGRWNYNAEAKGIDWSAWARELHSALQASGRAFLVKDDLARFLP
jgi:DNA repair photolyase